MDSFWDFFEKMVEAIPSDTIPARGAPTDLPLELLHPRRLRFKAATGKSNLSQAEFVKLVTEFHANMNDTACLDDLADFPSAAHSLEMPTYIM